MNPVADGSVRLRAGGLADSSLPGVVMVRPSSQKGPPEKIPTMFRTMHGSRPEMRTGKDGQDPMKPIRFSCVATLALAPDVIAGHILDVSKWPEFRGYGLLPGIRSAEFEVRTPSVVGSRVRVVNTDGSTHVEEIVEWRPDQRVEMHLKDFSAPLSLIAAGIEETWDFERIDDETRVTRSFRMHARSASTRPALRLISLLLKKAVARHLGQLENMP